MSIHSTPFVFGATEKIMNRNDSNPALQAKVSGGGILEDDAALLIWDALIRACLVGPVNRGIPLLLTEMFPGPSLRTISL